jgi:hypothetical protein
MVDVEKQVAYWRDGAVEDWAVAPANGQWPIAYGGWQKSHDT